jgi:hypothetical protein
MRLTGLLLLAILVPGPGWAQQGTPSPAADQNPSARTETSPHFDLPVSLDRIKEGLEQPPTLTVRPLNEQPTFRMEIRQQQKLDELMATLSFKTTRAPAGGLYWDEVQRQMWPSVDNPLRQPYAAFNQGELLTILVENLVGKYLAGKAINAVSSAERARAEAAARDEVLQAIRDYCTAQPNGGAGIQICSTSSASR